jgi:signal transduction histidine kinase/DNA-binding response OmpR family regulator
MLKKRTDKSFLDSIKGKILIAAIAGLVAIGGAWLVARFAFSKVLYTVEQLSAPNQKLLAVNNVLRDIVTLNRFEPLVIFPPTQEASIQMLSQTESIQTSLDSLSQLCADNPLQLALVDSVKLLLQKREDVLLNYLDVRNSLALNQGIEEEIKLLEEIVAHPMTDSLAVTTAYKIVTTIIQTQDTISIEVQRNNALKALWNNITRKNKTTETAEVLKERKIVEEEVQSKVDTIAFANRDTILQEAKDLISSINKEQMKNKEAYFESETELTQIERSFYGQVLNLLSAVEQETIRQDVATTETAQVVLGNSIFNIIIILILFLVITLVLVVLILTDISRSNSYRLQLVAAKEEAERESISRQRFLSNMSHEIRTPLQSIIGYSEQLKKSEDPNREDLTSIYHSSVHLLQVVNEILDISQINSGKFTIERAPVDLLPLLEDVMLYLKPQATEKSIDLIFDGKSLPDKPVLADAFRLKQILLNLLGNSLKFTGKGYVKLEVLHKAQGAGAEFCFVVRDTGIGIAEDKLQNIFNYFEQAHSSIARNFGGSGLGLSIVKALVDAQKGSIEVKSEPGKGSVFTVKLYFEFAAESKIIAPMEEMVLGNFTGQIWLVEDDLLIANLCRIMLDKKGIKYRFFQSAEELKYTTWDEDVRLVITDIRLPGIGGVELCKWLRDTQGTKLGIAAITAGALPEEQRRVYEAGFDHILLKPFNESEFLSLIGHFQNMGSPDTGKPIPSSKAGYFATMRQMTMGDSDLMAALLAQFAADSKSDADGLRRAVEKDQSEQAAQILHKLAGRTAQAGGKEISAAFRKIEISLWGGNPIAIYAREIAGLMVQLGNLIDIAEAEGIRMAE